MSSSNPPDSGGSDQPFGRRSGKAPEKPNFAQTCILLSQYFKERGALGMATKLEAASKGRSGMSPAAPGTEASLLPNMERSVETPVLHTKLASPSTSMSMEEVEFRVPTTQGPRTAPMTIFYAGEVLVYDDFPSDKAREIMALAGKHVRSYSVIGTPGVDKFSFTPVVAPVSDIVPTPRNREPSQQGNGSGNFHVPAPQNRELVMQQPETNSSGSFLVPTPLGGDFAKQKPQTQGSGSAHNFLVPTPRNREPSQQQSSGSNNFLVPTPREPAKQQLQGNGASHFLVPTPREPAQQQSQANGSGHFLVPTPKEPAQQQSQANAPNNFVVPTPKEPVQPQSQANDSGNIVVSMTGIEQSSKQKSQANESDLPIARRASLHRFFSKRKDRAAAKAPYQVNGPLNLPPPEAPESSKAEAPESSNPWPETESSEGQSSKQHIDLNM